MDRYYQLFESGYYPGRDGDQALNFQDFWGGIRTLEKLAIAHALGTVQLNRGSASLQHTPDELPRMTVDDPKDPLIIHCYAYALVVDESTPN